jgi:zinc protease
LLKKKIIEGRRSFDASIVATYEKTPSKFDRSVEPAYGESPQCKLPTVWKSKLSSV